MIQTPYPRGSEWRRWDLHIHSKHSQESAAKLSVADVFAAAVDSGVSVISITDHTNFDALDEVWDLWETGTHVDGTPYRGLVQFLPGIELKASEGAKGIHFLVIFPKYVMSGKTRHKLDKQFLVENFLAKIDCSAADIQRAGGGVYKKGLFEIAVDLWKVNEIANSLGAVVIAHAGNKHNSIETEIKHAPRDASECELLNTLGSHKEKIMRNVIDICELPNWNEYHQGEALFYRRAFCKPSVVFPDNHNAFATTLTWIKADPTIEGLRQILREPENRIYIGEIPPKIEHVAGNATKFIKALSIKKREDATLNEERWFDTDLTLNHDLIAVIGNKGSGKSALADIVALVGDSRCHPSELSFLNEDKFRHPVQNKAGQFVATLLWENDHTSSRCLSDDTADTATELVKYIPQNYFEGICTDIGRFEKSEFYKKLKEVIFSRIPEADRLGQHSLDDLLAYKNEETYTAISILQDSLSALNKRIADLERWIAPEFRTKWENERVARKADVAAHDEAKPKEIPKPKETEETKEVAQQIRKLQEQLVEVETAIQKNTTLQSACAKKLAAASRLRNGIENIKARHTSFLGQSAEDAQQLGVELGKIVTLTVDSSPLDLAVAAVTKEKDVVDEALDPANEKSLQSQKKVIEDKAAQLRTKLDEPNKLYESYLARLKEWSKRREELVGDTKTEGSLLYAEHVLSLLKEFPVELSDKIEQRQQAIRRIYSRIKDLADAYSELHEPVQEFIESHEIVKNRFNLNFNVSIENEGFSTGFFDRINRQVRGSFSGLQEGQEVLNALLKRTDFSDEDSTLSFVKDLIDHLQKDCRTDKKSSNDIERQLRQDHKVEELYDYVFGLSYLRPRYTLKLGQKSLPELSPGERGALLLIFYLLIDKSETPLIIDQPEENLDNETVFSLLVPCIKEAKTRRQLVIVTHNPNIAVVCDAEQIIYAELNKADKFKLEYTCGAIEDPFINRRIVDVLEGTKPAFDKRGSKYLELNRVAPE